MEEWSYGGELTPVPQHIPFDYSNRAAFATKLSAFLLTGFAIPFVAAVYQMYVHSRRVGVPPSRLTPCPSPVFSRKSA